MSGGNLETIPEEGELPRISELIPKSPETIKRERDYQKMCDKYLDDKNLKLFYDMLVTNKNFRKLCSDTDFYSDNESESHNGKNTSGTNCTAGMETSHSKETIYRSKNEGNKGAARPLKQINKNIDRRNK